MVNPFRFLFYPLVVLVIFAGCDKDTDPKVQRSEEKSILTFKVEDYTSTIDLSNKTILIDVPAGTDVTQLAPIIGIPEKATISPASGTPQNFSASVIYTVTAEDQTTQVYTVRINPVYGLKKFYLKIFGISYPGEIDNLNKEILMKVSFADIRKTLSVSKLTAEAELLDKFTMTPGSGFDVSLEAPPEVTVKAINNAEYKYKILIKNTDAEITSFYLTDEIFTFTVPKAMAYPELTAGLPDDGLVVRVLSNLDVTNITPKMQISERAASSPLITASRNFSTEQVYTITSETGTTRQYTIRVIKEDVMVVNDQAYSTTTIPANGNSFFTTYISVSDIVSVTLVNTATSAEVDCTISKSTYNGDNYIYVDPVNAFPAGNYRMKVTLANGNTVIIKRKLEAK